MAAINVSALVVRRGEGGRVGAAFTRSLLRQGAACSWELHLRLREIT